MKSSDELNPLTSFFVLAWDAFKAPVFPYDEALRLARAALEATGLGRGAGDEAPGATALRAELLRLEGEGHPGREDRDERYRAGGGRGR